MRPAHQRRVHLGPGYFQYCLAQSLMVTHPTDLQLGGIAAFRPHGDLMYTALPPFEQRPVGGEQGRFVEFE